MDAGFDNQRRTASYRIRAFGLVLCCQHLQKHHQLQRFSQTRARSAFFYPLCTGENSGNIRHRPDERYFQYLRRHRCVYSGTDGRYDKRSILAGGTGNSNQRGRFSGKYPSLACHDHRLSGDYRSVLCNDPDGIR